MVYLFTLDSHELFGPFGTSLNAHAWAADSEKTSYEILTDSYCQQNMLSYPILKPWKKAL